MPWMQPTCIRKLVHGTNQHCLQVLLADLRVCSKTQNLKKGQKIHAGAVRLGYDSNAYVASALINMYAKCGTMANALQVFDNTKDPNVGSWTALILGYAENGEGRIALDIFVKMKSRGTLPDSVAFVAALKACTSLAVKRRASDLAECSQWGKQIHSLAVENGCDLDIFLQNTLIDMYAKCRRMMDAHQVFATVKYPNVVSWNVLILGYAENGQGSTALDLFKMMKTGGYIPNSVTLMAAIKACTSLALEGSKCSNQCKEIHDLAVKNGYGSNIYLQNTLIDMYAKCGRMVDAQQVFDHMPNLDVVSWNVLIMGYAECGQGLAALDLFKRMRNGGPAPNHVTFLAAIKACTSLITKGACGRVECIERGHKIYELAVNNGCASTLCLQNTLIDMYCKCGSMVDARQVFDDIKQPDLISWTALIQGYADNGQGNLALEKFVEMKTVGLKPDFVTFSAILKACALVGGLDYGRTIHLEIDRSHRLNAVLLNCLVDFYGKCGSLAEAQRVFDLHSQTRDIITWTSLLAGFSSCGDHESAFALFERLQDTGFRPDSITFISILTCCNHAGLVDKGKEYFDAMSSNHGVIPTVEHYNIMVDILGRSKKVDDAMALLQCMHCNANDITWTTILGVCHKWKNVSIGRLAFQSLVSFNDREPVAYVLMGQLCGSRGLLREQEMVMKMRTKLEAWRIPEETCWTNEMGEANVFVVDDTIV